MKKILAFGASNSSTSINKAFASYVAGNVENTESIIADLNDYELPIYGSDLEKAKGLPENATKFNDLLASVDGIVISLAEHNGNYTAVFKNLFDWISRIDMKTTWKNVPILLLATSPGGRGGANVLRIAKDAFPHFGGNVVADFSLPKYYENFSAEGIKDAALQAQLEEKIKTFSEALEV